MMAMDLGTIDGYAEEGGCQNQESMTGRAQECEDAISIQRFTRWLLGRKDFTVVDVVINV